MLRHVGDERHQRRPLPAYDRVRRRPWLGWLGVCGQRHASTKLLGLNPQNYPPTPIQTTHSYTYIGNWYSYTVDVAEAGEYSATFMGSSHHGGDLSFDVDLQVCGCAGVLSIDRSID